MNPVVTDAADAAAIARLIPRLSRFATYQLDANVPALSVAQLYVLERIEEGMKRGVDLAKRASVSAATMSGIVDRLVDAGLVRREPDRTDRRSYVLTLTDAGKAAVAAGNDRLVGGLADILCTTPAPERAAVARACTIIERALDARVAEVMK